MKEDKLRSISEEQLSQMEKKLSDLRLLMEITAVISSTLDLKELIEIVMEKAKEVMHVEACSILLMNKKTGLLEFEVAIGEDENKVDILKKHVTVKPGEGIAGWVAQNQKPLIVQDTGSDERFTGRADKMTGFCTRGIIAVPIMGRSGLIGVAEILNPMGRDLFSDYDLEIFQALCRQVAVAMENALFHKESLEKERLNQELELASTIQRSFLPDMPVFEAGRLRLSGVTIPAKHVSGDLYDFSEPLPDKAGLFIGDISGKGVSAALFMAKAISEFRFFMNGIDDPGALLGRLNRQLSDTPRGMFLTCIYAIADQRTASVRVAVAGHPPIIMIRSGNVSLMEPEGGPPLGIMDTDFPVSELALGPGDRMIMVTDGVFDAKNDKGERLGFDAVEEFARKNSSADNLPDLIAGHVNAFIGDADRADDVTIVELRCMH